MQKCTYERYRLRSCTYALTCNVVNLEKHVIVVANNVSPAAEHAQLLKHLDHTGALECALSVVRAGE